MAIKSRSDESPDMDLPDGCRIPLTNAKIPTASDAAGFITMPQPHRGKGIEPLPRRIDVVGLHSQRQRKFRLRPGNADSNTAADHVEILHQALAALPVQHRNRSILVRSDSAGATKPFVWAAGS